MQYGTLVHSGIEKLLTTLSLNDGFFKSVNPNIDLMLLKKDIKHLYNLLVQFLGNNFLAENIITLEKRFKIDLGSYFVSGKPDLILYNKLTTKKIVVDFKTDKNIFASKDKYFKQLAGYCLLTESIEGVIINTNYDLPLVINNDNLKIKKQEFLLNANQYNNKKTEANHE